MESIVPSVQGIGGYVIENCYEKTDERDDVLDHEKFV